LSEEHGFRQWRGLAHAVRGICVTLLDPSSSALEEIRLALEEYRGAGYQLGITALYVLLCPAFLSSHDCAAALELIDKGLATASSNSERIFEAELYRLKARALLVRDAPDAKAEVQLLLDEALSTARIQHAQALELRTAMDTAELWIDQGRRADALGLLAPVYASFSEGFDTQDLKHAKALLDQLQ
jgi:predicted ATPase